MFNIFKNQYNKSYAQLLRKIKKSTCQHELAALDKDLQELLTNRLEKNFQKNKPSPRFDIHEILLKNPWYLSYKKQWLDAHFGVNISLWEERVSYWEPLFAKVQNHKKTQSKTVVWDLTLSH